jgi:Glycosyl transferase family 11
MIRVNVNGRLGNQLFQYAFALAQSQKLKTKFVLQPRVYSFLLPKYFILPSYSVWRELYAWVQEKGMNRRLFKEIVFEQWAEPVEQVQNKTFNKVTYSGFFQSEAYFALIKQQLLQQEYVIKPKYQIDIKKLLNISNDKKNIVIHLRRTDYKNISDDILGTDLSLPILYYENALAQIQQIETYNLIFISDEIVSVKSIFGKDHYYSVGNTEIQDFQLLMQGDILILANSSFSWWGAYLNPKATQIFAPNYWLGFKANIEYPAKVIPENWIKVKVYEN